jgi:hypothetical protein
MSKKTATPKREMTPQEVSEEMRRRVMARWKDKTKVSPATIELVKYACAMGATVGRICDVLEISERTFYRFMDTSPEFATAVKGGRSIEHDRLVNKLVEMALTGNVTALIFALKSRHNYVDSGVGAATLVENKVSVNFILPDAMKPEQYLQTLTASAQIIAPRDAARVLSKPGIRGKVMRTLVGEASNG